MAQPIIGFAGLTHLGLNSAAAAAENGFAVVALDLDPARVAAIEAGRLPVLEPGLDELVIRNRKALSFTSDPAALSRCDLVYVACDVPTDDEGISDLTPIQGLITAIQPTLRSGAALVVLSQVPPGFTRSQVRPGLILYYQVETLIFGVAVERALKPERFIIGCADPAVPLHPSFSAYLAAFDCPILPMRYESAELAKISINCCLVASISVANTLAELCENVGANWSEIVPALKLDRRIGPYAYLKPGLGIAGGNLERDLATVIRFADQYATDGGLIHAAIGNSRHMRGWVERLLTRLSPPDPITVLGLAYKEDTNSIKNSAALALIAALPNRQIVVHDPVIPIATVARPGLHSAPMPIEACEGAAAVVIMTPWRQYTELDPADLARVMTGNLVIDPYGVLDTKRCAAAGLKHFVIGAARNL